ncbi:MAG: tetratricopeptide repeat protein [Phycisphaerae bacterium]|jgi:tetratricopeptide (TPR) repeat protein
MNNASEKKWILFIVAALAIITLGVYYQVCGHDFISYDDAVYVSQNPNVQAGVKLKTIQWAFTSGYAANWHPLTWISHMLDWQFFGSNPAGHHLTNLVFHILNTLLLFVVLKQMTSVLWQSAFVAALFALHPLHVESVAWIAERKDVLSAFFWLLTMAAYLRYVKNPGAAPYLLTLLTFALGLMSKPMLVTLPFVLLLLDYWPLERFQRRIPYRLIVEKIPLFFLSAVSSVVTFFVQWGSGALSPFIVTPLKFRVSNAVISYVGYIGKMIWPDRLAVFYPHLGQNLSILYIVMSAAFLLAVTIVILRFAKKRRYLVTGWFWYIGTLVPVIGFVQVGSQAMADRYSYITLTGLFIIIAWGIPDLLAKWRYKKIVLTLSAILVISAVSICSYFQLRCWQNSLTLFQHALDVTEDNHIAHLHIAKYMCDEGKPDEGIREYKKYLRMRPDDADVISDLGAVLCRQGRLDEGISEYKKYLRIKPDNSNVLNDIGVALSRQGKLDEAVEYFNQSLRVKPDFAAAHANLGYALSRRDDYNDAVVHLDEALRLDPDFVLAHYHLGQILAQKGEIPQAVAHFEKALELCRSPEQELLKKKIENQLTLYNSNPGNE